MTSLRDTFPRGLYQPAGAFRSSVDALLLADCAFAVLPALKVLAPTAASSTSTGTTGTTGTSTPKNAQAEAPLVIDLGTGCGMAACALGLRAVHARGVGIDIAGELIEAARRNVSSLELDDMWRMETVDAGDLAFLRQLCGTGTAHVVMANPPYRKEGEGRVSAEPLRRQALHAHTDTLHIFCRAARVLLRHHGYFCVVFPPTRLGELLDVLRQHELGTRSIRCVHTRPHKAAALLLVTARKNAAEDITFLPPLHVYAEEEGDALSSEARHILFEEAAE